MWANPQIPADLVTFTEEFLNAKLHFLCSVNREWSKVLKALDKSINVAPILFSLFRLFFQCSIIFSNACCVLWFLWNSAKNFEILPLINVLIREKIIIKFVIHVVLFTNWRNLSFFQNIRKFAHLYRFIKNICQIFWVDLSILLKNFVGIWPVRVDLFIGQTFLFTNYLEQK